MKPAMAFRFPDLLITATFGALSAQLSLRAEAAELNIDEPVAGTATPPAEQEPVREAFMGLAITFRRGRNTPRSDTRPDQ
jgi:hypothetical protein